MSVYLLHNKVIAPELRQDANSNWKRSVKIKLLPEYIQPVGIEAPINYCVRDVSATSSPSQSDPGMETVNRDQDLFNQVNNLLKDKWHPANPPTCIDLVMGSLPEEFSVDQEAADAVFRLKVSGAFLYDLHALFGNGLRLKMEMTKTTATNKILTELIVIDPFVPTLPTGCSHRRRQLPSETQERGPAALVPKRNRIDCSTHPMPANLEPGVDIYFTEDLELPDNWKENWYKINPRDNEETVYLEISLILSVEEDTSAQSKVEVVMKKMLDEELATDLEIVVAGGDSWKVLKCHSALLVAQSDVFKTMLEAHPEMQEAKTNRVVMGDVSEEAVRGLLVYLYCRELETAEGDSEIAMELLQTARKYLILNLEQDVKSLLLGKPGEWFSMDGSLAMFLFGSNVEEHRDLRTRAIQVLKGKPKQEMLGSQFYQGCFQNNDAARRELSLALSATL